MYFSLSFFLSFYLSIYRCVYIYIFTHVLYYSVFILEVFIFGRGIRFELDINLDIDVGIA